MQYIRINPVEVASILAHNAVVDELVTDKQIYLSEDDLWEELQPNELSYKEDVQDVFIRWYDYFYDTLTENHVE